MLNDLLGVHSASLCPGILELGEYVHIWLLLPFVILHILIICAMSSFPPNYSHMKVPPNTLIDLLGIVPVLICLS